MSASVPKVRLPFVYPVLQFAVLPLLVAIYPAVFHYANNTRLVLLSSFVELCVIFAGAGLVIYVLLAFSGGNKFPQSAMGAVLILIFFQTYGFVYDWLRSIDIFQVETYNFMPVWILTALYLAWILKDLNTKTSVWICQLSTFIFGILVLFNLVKVVPEEIGKRKAAPVVDRPISTNHASISEQQFPDIYYLIFDEAAGFEVARQYWHYSGVDQFVTFLEQNDFYVAEESHGGSIHTLRELSTRLNYKEFPIGNEYFETYRDAIANNSAMGFLKAHGYTLIAYDQRRMPYPTTYPMPVDSLIEESPERGQGGFGFLDDYKILVLQSTLVRSFLNQDSDLLRHRDMILYTSENIASTQIPSPKFVYAHLMFPHAPFVFAENGSLTASSQREYTNWQRYLDNYKFFLRIAQEMVKNILFATRGNAVIIIQSDHGARNFTHGVYSGSLLNYSENYKTWIVNVWYLPNCDDAGLTQDMDPINTFPIVFNCYFDANLPIKD